MTRGSDVWKYPFTVAGKDQSSVFVFCKKVQLWGETSLPLYCGKGTVGVWHSTQRLTSIPCPTKLTPSVAVLLRNGGGREWVPAISKDEEAAGARLTSLFAEPLQIGQVQRHANSSGPGNRSAANLTRTESG